MSHHVAKVFSSLVAVVGILLVGGRDARAQFRFGPPTNLGPLINTGSHEDSPTISADDLSLYFSDPADPHRPGGHGSSDLWVATREASGDPWGEPMNLGQVVNKTTRDHAPSISADGLSLYFSDGWALSDPSRPGGSGGPDLWVTTRPTASDPWTAAVNLGPTVNSSEREVTPFISADGLSLYFSSSRPGGSGDLDLWVTTRTTAADPWTAPVNLGPAVNSPGLDGNPSASPDGLTLFYNSDRPGGVGTHDLWVTTRPSVSDAWGPPVNLGDPVNTAASEYGPSVSSDGSTIYFSSDRGDGRGGRDIWQAPILAWPTEAATIFVRGECNGDGSVDISDAVCSLEWLFLGGEAPGCVAATNVNGDATLDISDPVSLLGFLFLGGPGPVAPFPDCGDGHLGADEQLGCEASTNDCPEGR